MSKDQVTDKGAVTIDDEALDDVQGGVSKIDSITVKQTGRLAPEPAPAPKHIGNTKYEDLK